MLKVPEIKEIIRRYNLGISPRKMGQCFLVDGRALGRIASELGAGEEDSVLEIGAGLGALTGELLASGARVYAVERDRRFLQVLTDRFRDKDNLQIVRSDILEMDLGPYAMGMPKSLRVVGNIPYSLTSPILEFLLRQRQWVRRVLLTVQKEVADRIVAGPGSKTYSSISLLVQVAFKPSIAFTIHPGAFYPQPKVTSAVLCLDPLEKPAVPPEQEEGVLKLVRSIFTHRRKTLLNALLTGGISLPKEELARRLKEAGIDPNRRPETFHLEELICVRRSLVSSNLT